MPDIRKKKLGNACPFDLPRKFWTYLLDRAGCNANQRWMELGKKDRNRLLNTLLNDTHEVQGKTTFKEEFVTCGGVDLSEVNFNSMQSRVAPGLYFAGEVLDVDGITGGTITSKGVDEMINRTLKVYLRYFESQTRAQR